MKLRQHSIALILSLLAGFVSASSLAGSPATELEKQVEGLWFYTGLTTSDGNDMPLTGVFLFKDGIFMQHAVFDGESLETQGAMAHAGPYQARTDHVHLVAEQTISTAPAQSPALSFRANTEHDVTVARSGDELRLVFSMGTGTIQDFEYVGPGEGALYALEDGALALVDGHCLLVQGNAGGTVAGYGRYERHGDELRIDVIRWTEANSDGAINVSGKTVIASFDGQALTLDSGHRFKVRK